MPVAPFRPGLRGGYVDGLNRDRDFACGGVHATGHCHINHCRTAGHPERAAVSPDLIGTVTDSVLAEVTAWQARPPATVYPVVW